jgi:hypothetical protein
MSSLRTTIESLASEFAASILDALRSASIDELADVAGRGVARRGPGRPRSEAGEGAAAGPTRRGHGGRLGRRSAGDISRMIESIVDVLAKSSAGLRAEQIRETLGVEAKELPRPLAEAISSGRITKSGQKRATTYFAGSGGAAATTGKRRGRTASKKTSKKR